MSASRIPKTYRLSEDTLAHIDHIIKVLEDLTGIRPTATAVIELAVKELRREKLGRRSAEQATAERPGDPESPHFIGLALPPERHQASRGKLK